MLFGHQLQVPFILLLPFDGFQVNATNWIPLSSMFSPFDFGIPQDDYLLVLFCHHCACPHLMAMKSLKLLLDVLIANQT